MLPTHTNYHAELQRTLTTTSILPVAISMMITAFLQELLFRKSDFPLVGSLFDSCCFSEYRSLLPIPYAYQPCPPPPLYWNGLGSLYGLPKKRKSISGYLTSCPMESFHLRCYNPSHNYSDVTEKTFSVFLLLSKFLA